MSNFTLPCGLIESYRDNDLVRKSTSLNDVVSTFNLQALRWLSRRAWRSSMLRCPFRQPLADRQHTVNNDSIDTLLYLLL